jgi:hypothetical protein
MNDYMFFLLPLLGFIAFYSFMAWREDRINQLTDAAWRAGYEQGMKVSRSVR